MADSPWRVALMASSSWSHSFLTEKHWQLWPDVAADRALYDALEAGDYAKWHAYKTDQIEESGQHEVLNWFCLLGAMEALGRKPDKADVPRMLGVRVAGGVRALPAVIRSPTARCGQRVGGEGGPQPHPGGASASRRP